MMDWLTRSTPSTVRADDAARGLRVPVLFVHGALDAVAPLHGGRELAGLTGRADLFVIDRAGHADLLEIDGEGRRRVTAFLLAALTSRPAADGRRRHRAVDARAKFPRQDLDMRFADHRPVQTGHLDHLGAERARRSKPSVGLVSC